ncbi:HU family DNA-binding protein [Limibacterium fermenti]|jgi:predicted histone-like DNA-binding protein|uniref:HU family DNA-binding protein n=1 Tax=Limibacterium fermenti TaxID=3229863 RepID=UPI000E86A77E|nr:DNA-binding protein [Porphyromonadaceae bacterium]
MKYKLIQKPNPLEPEAERKWYASPVKAGTINNYQLSKKIAGRSSLTRGDVMNVIENIIDEIPQFLMEGYSVNLDNLGTLRLSISSEGVNDPEKFCSENIKSRRIVFTPSPEFKLILQAIHFEKAK